MGKNFDKYNFNWLNQIFVLIFEYIRYEWIENIEIFIVYLVYLLDDIIVFLFQFLCFLKFVEVIVF